MNEHLDVPHLTQISCRSFLSWVFRGSITLGVRARPGGNASHDAFQQQLMNAEASVGGRLPPITVDAQLREPRRTDTSSNSVFLVPLLCSVRLAFVFAVAGILSCV